MKFASRYELEDPLLTTAVETFCATDRQTQQRVLVHVFPAAEHGLNPSSSPDAVGLRFLGVTNARVVVRDAGVDRVTGYAYVVTEEIAEEVIEGWTSGPAAATTGTENFNTAEFLRSMGGTPSESAPKPGSAPGAFTREFMSLDEGAAHSAVSTRSPAPAQGPGAFTRMFFGNVSSAESAGKTSDPRSASENTKQLLPESPTPMSARPQPGAFTRIFGQPGTPVAPEPQPQQPGPFTRMFQNGDRAGTKPATRPTPPPVREPAAPIYQRPQPAPPREPVRPAPVAPATPAASREPATRFFSEDRARVPQPVTPAGPSDYTKVIAVPAFARPVPAPAPPASVNTPSVPPPPSLPVATPQAPPVQGYPAPAYPAAPPPPPYAAPAPPPYAAPAAPPYAVPAPPPYAAPVPAAPQRPAAPKPAAPVRSWMPFIILINVLFLIAILLIVVFALRGH